MTTIAQFERVFGKEPLGKNLSREARRLVREGVAENEATSRAVEARLQQVEERLRDLENDRYEEAD